MLYLHPTCDLSVNNFHPIIGLLLVMTWVSGDAWASLVDKHVSFATGAVDHQKTNTTKNSSPTGYETEIGISWI